MGIVRVIVAGQPHPLVRMAGAPFAVRVCRVLLRLSTPSRWCAWRVLLSGVSFRRLLLVSPIHWSA